jgi:hypothetical protein
MKARVIKPYTDKNTLQNISKGIEIEISKERFSELTTGPRGIFVEEIKEAKKPTQTKKK